VRERDVRGGCRVRVSPSTNSLELSTLKFFELAHAAGGRWTLGAGTAAAPVIGSDICSTTADAEPLHLPVTRKKKSI